MGFFEDIFEFPEKIVEKTVETVVRLPEIPISVAKGIIDGLEKGVDKLEKKIDRHSP